MTSIGEAFGSNPKAKNLIAYQGDAHKMRDIAGGKEAVAQGTALGAGVVDGAAGAVDNNAKFDLIFGCNLIDRLHTPSDWVLQSRGMLRGGKRKSPEE
jgi:hypothetical protein